MFLMIPQDIFPQQPSQSFDIEQGRLKVKIAHHLFFLACDGFLGK